MNKEDIVSQVASQIELFPNGTTVDVSGETASFTWPTMKPGYVAELNIATLPENMAANVIALFAKMARDPENNVG